MRPRRFTTPLRTHGGPAGSSEFLLQRRDAIPAQAEALATAIRVLDKKIEHYRID